MATNSETMPEDAARYAWNRVPRAELPKRPPSQRVADFCEIYSLLDEEAVQAQASRCIQCPEPICIEACPINNQIPDWLALTAEGKFKEAAEVLRDSGCMGEVFSRVCTQPCETSCILEGKGDPVAIKAVERFLLDYGFAHGVLDLAPKPNGHRVAVLDAGPCGLTCAYDLARQGYEVTVLDRQPEVGGLLLAGIPAFKLDRQVVERRLGLLKGMGVRFRLGVELGEEVTLTQLQAEFDAVFLGGCAGQARTLDVPGAELAGVHQGLTFIAQKNLGVPSGAEPIEAGGKRVVVLGGGNLAMDCLRTALRCHPAEVWCVYRRDAASMPAHAVDYQEAIEEGARFEFLATPVEAIANAAGQVTHVRLARTTLGAPDATGRPAPEVVPGSTFELAADLVLIAYGLASVPFRAEGDFASLALDDEGRILVDQNLMTNLTGVFAGGTPVRGAGQFLDSVRDARKAAIAIHRYVCG